MAKNNIKNKVKKRKEKEKKKKIIVQDKLN